MQPTELEYRAETWLKICPRIFLPWVCLLCLSACGWVVPNSSAVSSQENPILAADVSRRLGASLQLRLSQLSAEENPSASFLLRTQAPLTPGQRSQLEAAGAKVRTVAGDIVTVLMPIRQAPVIAGLDFVSYVELSSPLYPESPR